MYAIIRRHRESSDAETREGIRGLVAAHVHFGFSDRRQAETWNRENFPSPEYNLIVPCSEFDR